MPYVTVKDDTEEKLHFCREPSARAWAIVIGKMDRYFLLLFVLRLTGRHNVTSRAGAEMMEKDISS